MQFPTKFPWKPTFCRRYPVARYPRRYPRKAASSWRWPAREEKVLPGVFGPCGAQARESAVFSLVLAVVYCPSASSRWCWTARHRAAGDVENPFDSYIRNPTALCRRPVFPKSTVKSTDKKKSVSPLACTAIERKTQPKAAWIWKIVLHPPLHPEQAVHRCY